MSTEQEYQNHPLTEFVIKGVNMAKSMAMSGKQTFDVVRHSFSELKEILTQKKHFEENFEEEQKMMKRPANKLVEARHSLVKEGKEKIVGIWMLSISVLITVLLCLGAYSRLLSFGHSITGMHASHLKTGYQLFKSFLEHVIWKKSTEFEFVFLREYLSTMTERLILLGFQLPFFYYLIRGYLKSKLTRRLIGVIAIHLLQSWIGSWIHHLESYYQLGTHDRITVSPYRMFVHWNTTMIICGVLFWNSLTLLRRTEKKATALYHQEELDPIRKRLQIASLLSMTTFAAGTLVAANDGASEFNTFPLMNGRLIPEGYLQAKDSLLRDLFENVATVQFHHRLLAYATYSTVIYLFMRSYKTNLPRSIKRALITLFAFANLQLLNGVLLLWTRGYYLVGSFHQSNAILIIAAALFALHSLSIPASILSQRIPTRQNFQGKRKTKGNEATPTRNQPTSQQNKDQ